MHGPCHSARRFERARLRRVPFTALLQPLLDQRQALDGIAKMRNKEAIEFHAELKDQAAALDEQI